MSDVCVVGLGKIGLPLACAIARGGHRVRGADISDAVVERVNASLEPFPNEAGLADALAETVASGALTATTDTTAAVAESDVVVIVVPLVVDDQAMPDFRAMDSATVAVSTGLQPGTLVSYETTLPVGTTRNRFAPMLADRSGLVIGEELFVVHSPERVFSGRIFEDLRRYPKLVGGVDAEAGRRGAAFYETFIDFDDRPDLDRPNGVWDLGNAEAAELAKLAETTYRDLNIAFANEIANAAISLGIDVHPVIAACNSQPFSHIHQPGISVGGHCIPVYPHFLRQSVPGATLAAQARKINDAQPATAVARLSAALNGLAGRSVVVLGLAYRAGVKEHAFSGCFSIVDALTRHGAHVSVHDPLYEDGELAMFGLEPWHLGAPADAAILHTAHPSYRDMTSADIPGVRIVYDGRAILERSRWQGVRVLTVGTGT